MISESQIPMVVAFAFNGYENVNGKHSAKCKFCNVVIKEDLEHTQVQINYILYTFIFLLSHSRK